MSLHRCDIAIVGAGAAGIAVAASLKKRQPQLSITLIDPAKKHYYQPGWTMVGRGVFKAQSTERDTASLIPKGVNWLAHAVTIFDPLNNALALNNDDSVQYEQLVVAAGLSLNWDGVEGLAENLGKNGVTSNYRYDTAPYTWELVKNLKGGRAVFTQPPMPIKCAGAPQKAMYLSADHWRKQGRLKDIQIDFCTATPGLFGVADYVLALMKYVERYAANLNFQTNLTKIDGARQVATFSSPEGEIEKPFDMLHVCPPQCAPSFISKSALADESGWVDVDQATLQHKRFDNIWSCGDVMNAPNAKTAAAARAGTRGRGKPACLSIRQVRGASLQRLRLLPAYGRERQNRAGRIRIRRQIATFLLEGDSQWSEADALGLASKSRRATLDLLECHAEGPRVDGQKRRSVLTRIH